MTKAYTVPRQDGRLVVITGTGGLGYEAAVALAGAGARVVLAGRNVRAGAEAVARIAQAAPGAKVEFEALDLASLASVADFAGRMKARAAPIDRLVNNAGVMSPPRREVTADGFELQFGVNYLGHFALTLALLPLLRQAGDARVVNVTSLAQHYAKPTDDLQSEARYQPGRAYCLSKFLQAMFTVEFQRRSAREGWGVSAMAVHPGFARTNLFQTGGGFANFVSTRLIGPLAGQSATAGAWPTLYAATSPEAQGGRLYGPKGFMEMRGAPGECRFAKAACDPERAAEIWALSERLCG